MDTLIERVRSCLPAPGVGEVLIPGKPERRHQVERRRSGIPYSAVEAAALRLGARSTPADRGPAKQNCTA
jgi:LDH2 family malate/lactate/ureidoglycolate dehydrogenase